MKLFTNKHSKKAKRSALAVEEPTASAREADGEVRTVALPPSEGRAEVETGLFDQEAELGREAELGQEAELAQGSEIALGPEVGQAPPTVEREEADPKAASSPATPVEVPGGAPTAVDSTDQAAAQAPCDCGHKGRLTFGPAAALPAAPRAFPEQLMVVPSTVYDTVLDGMEDEHLAVRAVSVRGHGHRYKGEVRQDSMSFRSVGDAVLCVVADGVSSGKHSQLGSATAALEAARWPEFATPWATSGGTLDISLFAAWLGLSASSTLIARAEVATTMALARIPEKPANDEEGRPEWAVTLLTVGDSGFRVIRDGHIEADDKQPTGFADSRTQALPLCTNAEVSEVVMREGDVLLIASDGVLNIMGANPDYRAAIAGLWTHGDPEPAELLRVVDATVKSFSDDRTLVGIRFKEVAHDAA